MYISDKVYDVVVVGAGNAGLMAALKLQKAGKKTLIVEQHNLPGGCASSYVRGRFEIDPSLHELAAVGSAQNLSLGMELSFCLHFCLHRALLEVFEASDTKIIKKVLTVKSFASKNFQVLCPLRDST